MDIKLAVVSVTISLLVSSTPITHSSDPDPLQDFCIPLTTNTASNSANSHFLPCKNSSLATPDDFVLSGIKFPSGALSSTGFSGILVTAASFPGLNTLGMSFARADLKPGELKMLPLSPEGYRGGLRVNGPGLFPRGLLHFQTKVGNLGIQRIPDAMFGSGVNDEVLEKAFVLSLQQVADIRSKFLPKVFD